MTSRKSLTGNDVTLCIYVNKYFTVDAEPNVPDIVDIYTSPVPV